MRTIYTLLFLSSLLFACKHEHDEPDPHHLHPVNSATFHNVQPLSGSVLNDGDSMTIKADVIGLYSLHGYHINIHKHGDTSTLFKADDHVHNDTIQIFKKWKISVPATSTLDVDMTVVLNHDDDTAFRRIQVMVVK